MKKKKEMRGMGRERFLRHESTISESLKNGRPKLAIYNDLKKDLNIGYSMFCRYIEIFLGFRFKTTTRQKNLPAEKHHITDTNIAQHKKQTDGEEKHPGYRITKRSAKERREWTIDRKD